MDVPTGQLYYVLHELLADKNYHILTTNQDTQFGRIFPPEKISAVQGDWRYFQCGHRCHDKLYPSVEIGHRLNDAVDVDLKVPSELIPHCPECGAEMEPWVRSFVFLEGRKALPQAFYITVNPKDACLPAKLSDFSYPAETEKWAFWSRLIWHYNGMQCAHACHKTLYTTLEMIQKMAQAEKNGSIPDALVSKCPKCGGIVRYWAA